MTIHATDVAIVGGGMVGGALALGLAQQGFTVTVIEHGAAGFDPAAPRMCGFRRSARLRSAC
jgi:2-octaprenyl-3-methyl-6-methoxy-1,4-benzoquinol hydroxylase